MQWRPEITLHAHPINMIPKSYAHPSFFSCNLENIFLSDVFKLMQIIEKSAPLQEAKFPDSTGGTHGYFWITGNRRQ